MLQPQSLRYFAAVARTGSLRKASESFFVAPSAISRQIANLERELGTALFERSAQGMTLTAAGRVLLAFALENDARLDRTRADIHDLTDLKRGTVRLAVVEAVASDFLPRLMMAFGARFPGIDFSIDVCGTHEVADRIATDAAEIGVAFNVLSRDDLIVQGRIAQPLQLICRPSHPLADRDGVTMAELADARVALPEATFGIRYLIDKAAAHANVSLRVCCVANSLQLIKAMVAGSDVISFMPPLTFVREAAAGQLRAVAFQDKACRQASLDIVTARDHKLSVAGRSFLDVLLASRGTR